MALRRRQPTSLPAMLILLTSLLAAAEAHNITAILHNFPDYSLHNSYLTRTKLADEVDSRETLTCLMLPNTAMSNLAAAAAKRTPSSLKTALRLLVLLDYFDPQKLHDIHGGSSITTTLYQTTGEALGRQGFVNITDLSGGRVAFRSAAPGSVLSSNYTRSVRQIPYNISVLEVSAPIVFPGLFDSGSTSAAGANLTAVLEKAGCKTFAALVSSSGMIKSFDAAIEKGLTLFAPNDEAFRAKGAPDLSSLSSADLVTVLQYHAVADYEPKDSLKALAAHRPIATMASGAPGNYELTVSVQGDDVMLHTGVDSSLIATTELDDPPVCVMTVDAILLPWELFGRGTASAPGPGSAQLSPWPSAAAPALAPVPKVLAPAPVKMAPPEAPEVPEPPASPALAPAESPDDAADEADSTSASAKVRYFRVVMAAAAAASWALM